MANCGGVTDLIQNGDNGLLVPAGEVTHLAEALRRLMVGQTLREKFSIRAAVCSRERHDRRKNESSLRKAVC
jgi:glycosyltransferase involved in cell wall biosynthesis